jgi:hypothetical protein
MKNHSSTIPSLYGLRVLSILLLLFALLLLSAWRAATVSHVTLTSSANPIRKGQSATLSCTTFYSDGTLGSCVSPVYTDDQSHTVVRVSGNTISGYSIGSATVKVTVSGVSATLAMKVIPPTQEALGVITATQVAKGLGFNVDPASDWEFQMAAAAGATHVRFQCGWATVELQTPPPQNTVTSNRYALQPYCQSAYTSSRNYSLHPIVIAGYGPPYHTILRVTVPGGAPAGATSIGVQFVPGQGVDTLSSLAPFSDTLIRSDGTQISIAHSYPGALITAVKVSDTYHATLTLASALSSALPANTTTLYTVNEYLYPPPATSSPSDSSVMRYAEYAEFLAQSLADAGLTGEIELWNEPPWPDDRWDERANSYDLFPGPFNPGPKYAYLPNWGFVGALQGRATPVGVSYIWAGTEKSGSNSVLDPQMQLNSGVAFVQPPVSVLSESFHPYGNSPEDGLWIAPCWATTTGNNDFFSCNMFGLAGGNFSLAAQEDYFLKISNPAYGVSHNMTETGFGLANGDADHQARFIMRQFLGFQAAGVTPISFYRLYDTSPDKLGFLDSSRSPLPAYTAISGFMSDLAKIANPPVSSYSSSTFPSIASYSGPFPLDSVHIIGSRAGDKSNSDILALWQRSYTSDGSRWATMPQPGNGSVTVSIAKGWKVIEVMNLVTRRSVSYTTSSQKISFAVSDDPIEVIMQAQ